VKEVKVEESQKVRVGNPWESSAVKIVDQRKTQSSTKRAKQPDRQPTYQRGKD